MANKKNDESSGKKQAIDIALKQIEKEYGKGAIMKMGDHPQRDIDVIPTGSISLDAALGIGGIPRGRAIEIYGTEASGKTTLALHIIAQAQKAGGIAVFIDAEHALDPVYAKKLGVDIDNLYISQPDTGEQALEIAETLIRSGGIDIVVIDSVAALVPKAEIEGEMGDVHVGLQARLMSQALRKLTGVLSKSNTAAVFINQVRYKIGVMFGNPMTTPGGLALKFHSSIRMEIRRIGTIKKGDTAVGNNILVKVVKNKVAPPFKEAHFDLMYNKGISRVGEILTLGTNFGLIEKLGTWYSYKGDKMGQGKDNASDYLINNPKAMAEVEIEIKKQLGLVNEEKESADK
jgi:recombination protein RecA